MTEQKTRINSTIDSKLEKKFRETVYKTHGLKKGNIQEALEEAINDWIVQKKKESQKK